MNHNYNILLFPIQPVSSPEGSEGEAPVIFNKRAGPIQRTSSEPANKSQGIIIKTCCSPFNHHTS